MILDRPQQVRVMRDPEPGIFAVRSHRGGPWLPARITSFEAGAHGLRHGWGTTLSAEIFGQPVPVENVWIYGWRIDDYDTVATEYLDAVGRENMYASFA